jgi:hypothetical protein
MCHFAMKKLTKNMSLRAISSVLLLAFTTMPASAWVKDISLERLFVGENVRIHQVDVKCRIVQSPRSLRRVVSSKGPWCSVDLPELCADKKIVAARKLCSYSASEFRELIASGASSFDDDPVVKKTATVNEKSKVENTKNDLLQEKMLIEERRIQIEQRRIELSRREISLKKKLTSMIESIGLEAS